jgi:alkanesulfonate monooxygenase SsuD/methylene tetrahydromethanopterin reductase-like flavin-dependent oxidoreductase (luciferase family)
MEEQIEACRALWSEAPATFKGRYVSFERVSQLPFPLQRGGIPIWLGVSDSDRSLDRVATLADGWCPPSNDPARLAVALENLRRRLEARGRDPNSLQTRIVLPIIPGPSGPDLDASLARVAEYHKLGVAYMEITPAIFGRGLGDLDGILKAIYSAR